MGSRETQVDCFVFYQMPSCTYATSIQVEYEYKGFILLYVLHVELTFCTLHCVIKGIESGQNILKVGFDSCQIHSGTTNICS